MVPMIGAVRTQVYSKSHTGDKSNGHHDQFGKCDTLDNAHVQSCILDQKSFIRIGNIDRQDTNYEPKNKLDPSFLIESDMNQGIV